MTSKIILEAYETNNDDFTALVVFFSNGERTGFEKVGGFATQDDAFIAGFDIAFADNKTDDFLEAKFSSNKFYREYGKAA